MVFGEITQEEREENRQRVADHNARIAELTRRAKTIEIATTWPKGLSQEELTELAWADRRALHERKPHTNMRVGDHQVVWDYLRHVHTNYDEILDEILPLETFFDFVYDEEINGVYSIERRRPRTPRAKWERIIFYHIRVRIRELVQTDYPWVKIQDPVVFPHQNPNWEKVHRRKLERRRLRREAKQRELEAKTA